MLGGGILQQPPGGSCLHDFSAISTTTGKLLLKYFSVAMLTSALTSPGLATIE